MKLRKMMVVLVALLMILTIFSGCKKTEDQPDDMATDQKVETKTEEKEETQPEEKKEQVTLQLFQSESWWPYTAWEGRIPELVTEITGVNIEATTATDNTQLPLMIASGDLGDLVCAFGLDRMSDSRISYDYDSLIEEYNVDFPIHSVRRFTNQAPDGNIYTILCAFSPNSEFEEYPKAMFEGKGLSYRTDIYEALGSPAINNLEDLEALFQMVVDNYPDMTPAIFDGVHKLMYMQSMLGSPQGGFYDEDGVPKYYLRHEKMKLFYQVMNRWFNNGYIKAEQFSYPGNDEELCVSGVAFADIAYDDTSVNRNKACEEAGVDWRYTQLLVPLTEDAVFYNTSIGFRGLYIPLSCSDPEAAIKFTAYAYSREGQNLMLWGEEGTDWNWNEDHTYPVLEYDWQDGDYIKANGMKFWGWLTHDMPRNTLPLWSAGGDSLKARQLVTELTVQNPVLGMINFDPDSDEEVIETKLEDLELRMTPQIIMAANEEEAMALYDQMIAEAEQIGMSDLEAAAEPMYTAKIATYNEIKDNKE